MVNVLSTLSGAAGLGMAEPMLWEVGALCKAVADALHARFNPVSVRGELTGFSRATSGHCYFSIKDQQGQLRCAMFRRHADGLTFSPQNGDLVELQGSLGVYEARGDLQLIVERMQPAGQGALFEQFVRLKAQLEAQGLFDSARKRALPMQPRAIAILTSLGAAALHDMVVALERRVPHIPVMIIPVFVQGVNAAPSMVKALLNLYRAIEVDAGKMPENNIFSRLDVIILARGGGSLEDLWAFNDAQLAHTIVQSPVPVVTGVGHETDFTIADFCADVRAPTPTAAAELVAHPRETWMAGLDVMRNRLTDAAQRYLDQCQQRLDYSTARLGRPSNMVAGHRMQLIQLEQRLRYGAKRRIQTLVHEQNQLGRQLILAIQQASSRCAQQLARLQLQLEMMDPRLVLQRGYAILHTPEGAVISSVQQAKLGDRLLASLADGEVDLTVAEQRLI